MDSQTAVIEIERLAQYLTRDDAKRVSIVVRQTGIQTPNVGDYITFKPRKTRQALTGRVVRLSAKTFTVDDVQGWSTAQWRLHNGVDWKIGKHTSL
jgi:hypothetical protein